MDDGPSPQNSSKRNPEQTWSMDDELSPQNSSKRNHEETLKKLEDDIKRLSSDVKKLYHDVSSLSNACNEPKPSRRKLFESMEAVVHHIGNLSIDEYNLNENVRDLTRNVCVRPKLFDIQKELERKINKKMRNDDSDSFKTPSAQESKELLSRVNRVSKHLSESSKCDPLLPLPAPDITNRRNTYPFPNDTVSKGLLSKVQRFSRHSSESSISEPPLPAPDENKRRKTYPFENDADNRVLLQLSQSLFCNTTQRKFGQRKSSEEFGCRSIDYYPVLRSLSVYSVTKVDISPSFSTFEQFKADKLGRCTLRWVAPLTDKRRSSFNRFKQFTADKLDYDRYSLQWEGPPSNKRPSSFRDFVHKSAVLDKCGNVLSGSSYESGVIKRLLTQLDVGTSSCHPVAPSLFALKSGVLDKRGKVLSGSSCESGALKRMLKKLDDVGTSSCHPVSPTQFVQQQCSRPTEMINRHINSLNNRTVLMPLQQLEISYDRDVDFLYPLDNNLITAIMRTRSCQSLRSRTSCRKSISQQYPPKYTPNHTQCLPPVWPLECLTANSPPNLICPPKYPPLESRSWPWVGQMTRSCSNVNDTEIRCLCGCGQEDACLDPEVQNTPARLVEDCAGRDCAEWSDYEWEWLIPPSLRGFSAYDILVGSIMMLALIPLTKYDVVSDRYLILLLFLILTYRHY